MFSCLGWVAAPALVRRGNSIAERSGAYTAPTTSTGIGSARAGVRLSTRKKSIGRWLGSSEDAWGEINTYEESSKESEVEKAENLKRFFDSIGFKDGYNPNDTDTVPDEVIEQEVQEIRKQDGVEPMQWSDFFSESELEIMQDPDLPFDPLSGKFYRGPTYSDEDRDLSTLPIVPIEEVDLSEFKPIRRSDLEKKPEKGPDKELFSEIAKELAEVEGQDDVIAWGEKFPEPSQAEIEEWREAERKRGGSVGTPQSERLHPNGWMPEVEAEDEWSTSSSSTTARTISPWSTMKKKLCGDWRGYVLEFDGGAGSLGESWKRSSSFHSKESVRHSLCLDPDIMPPAPKKQAEVHIVSEDLPNLSTSKRSEKHLDSSLDDLFKDLVPMPSGTVVFEDGSISAGSRSPSPGGGIFFDFLFRHEGTCFRIHSSASSATDFDRIRVAIETNGSDEDAIVRGMLGPDSRPSIEELCGEWKGQAVSVVPSLLHGNTTHLDCEVETQYGPVTDDDVMAVVFREFNLKVEPPTTEKKSGRNKSKPSKKVKEARKRDRARLSSCNVVESIRLGQFESDLAGVLSEDKRSIEYPRLENGIGGRKTFLLPGRIALDVPTAIPKTEQWYVSAVFISKSNQRVRMVRSFNPDGEFVGAAMCTEDKQHHQAE